MTNTEKGHFSSSIVNDSSNTRGETHWSDQAISLLACFFFYSSILKPRKEIFLSAQSEMLDFFFWMPLRKVTENKKKLKVHQRVMSHK